MEVHRRRVAAQHVTGAALTVAACIVALAGPAPAARAATSGPKVPGGEFLLNRSFLTPGQSIYPYGSQQQAEARLVSVGFAATDASSAAPTVLDAYLVLQDDGNLVEYAQDSGQVLFTTHTTTGVKLAFQGDHNVVLYDKAGRPLWQTHTAGSAAVYFGPYGNGELVTQRADGQFVSTTGTAMTHAPGVVVQSASSPNGKFVLQVQSDGNVVEYGPTGAVWNTHTAGRGPARLAAQLDGNLVVYSRTSGRPLWSSGTSSGTTAYRQLDVQDDGALVLWSTDGAHRTQRVWSNGVGG